MTNVADVRDRLNAIMGTVLPSYEKLADSYETSDNPNPIFEKGYSIGYSSGENITSEWCNLGQMRIRRQFLKMRIGQLFFIRILPYLLVRRNWP